MKPTSLRIAALLLCLAATTARAGLLDDDEARRAILDLRAKVDAIARDINVRLDAKSDKSQALEFVNQHEQTMAELARLRGQIEVLGNQIATAEKRQHDLYADLDARLKKLEPKEVNIDGKTAEVDPSEQKTYEAAMGLFKSGDYAGAAQSLGDFVRRYPASGYAANAQYYLGNAFYAARQYKEAIAAQKSVVANYPDSPRASEALLSIAASYTDLKDKKNARKALQQLVAAYPDSASAQTAKDRLKSLR